MPPARRYHHGDLPASLRSAAVELVAERGPHGFSLTEAARRVGVTAAAPYRHFPDRESLLADIAVGAYGELAAQLRTAPSDRGGAERLAAMAGSYVAFAAEHRALFQILFAAGIDKDRFPAVRQAGDAALEVVVSAAADLEPDRASALALALDLWALAHGYAALLSEGALADHDLDGAAAVSAAHQAASRLVAGHR